VRLDRVALSAIALLIGGVLLPCSAGAGPLLFSVSPRDTVLRQIDSADGSTVDASVLITLAGLTVEKSTGLARDPLTDTLYTLLVVQSGGSPFRVLATLDEATGAASSIGVTSQKFAGIAFADDGTLYGISGDGAAVPESLFTLNINTGSASLVLQLGDGSDGETIAFNPDDGLLYHASGIGNQNLTVNGEIFETIDPGTLAVTNVPLSQDDYQELTALMFSDGGFLAGDIGDVNVDLPGFYHVSAGGIVTFLGDMDHVTKGLVPVPEPVRWIQLVSGITLLSVLRRMRKS
jgi:hypothetical protein